MIPVIELSRAIPFDLTGNAAGGTGVATRRHIAPGSYVVVVAGGNVRMRDGDAEALNTRDVQFRRDVVIGVRLRSGSITIAAEGTEDATAWLVLIDAMASPTAGGHNLRGCE